ncbi:MAG: biotin transporter BioY [bacterium]|nr:biotin transporter BioY [bacterium]
MRSRAFVPLLHPPRSTAVRVVAVAAGAVALAVAARVELPLGPVPLSLQTYVVLMVAALFGARLGLIAIAVYLTAAAAGLPVLAGGASGVERLLGPTAGYLAGFAVAATLVGRAAERGLTVAGWSRPMLVMLAGHAVILGLGCAWLATRVGLREALADGLTPFLAAAAIKSLLVVASLRLLAPRSS